mmetsp:Transcript_281/g.542  ORF Transcript_281/g.542 Transcript_281/m.542 type:complete len:241 (+) Transcript_281:50-772(+)
MSLLHTYRSESTSKSDKRAKVSNLILSGVSPEDYQKLSNGTYACTVCRSRPVFTDVKAFAVHRSSRGHRLETGSKQLKEYQTVEPPPPSDNQTPAGAINSSQSKISCIGLRADLKQLPNGTEAPPAGAINNSQSRIGSAGGSYRGSKHRSPIPYAGVQGSNHKPPVAGVPGQGSIGLSSPPDTQKPPPQKRPLSNGNEPLVQLLERGWKRNAHGEWYRDPECEFDSDEDLPSLKQQQASS